MPLRRLVSRALLPAASVLLLALGARPAPAADAPWEQVVVDLASVAPSGREAAAKRAASLWPEGARAAPVLAALAVEDPDAGVRRAAAQAVEALAQKGLEAWAAFLAAARGASPKDFHEVAAELHRLGAKATAVDFCAGLGYSDVDAVQAAVLAALPMAWRSQDTQDAQEGRPLFGLDVVLLDRAAHGGPKTRQLALAGLALLANATLRDQGSAAAAPAGAASPVVPALLALLDDQRPWIPPLALGLLGAAAPRAPAGASDPVAAALGKRLQAVVATVPEDGDSLERLLSFDAARPLVTALRRLGPAAAGALPDLRRLRKRGARGMVETLVRVGSPGSLFVEEPDVLADYVRRRPEDAFGDREYLREFLETVEALLRVDPPQARRARAAVRTIVAYGLSVAGYENGANLGLRALVLLPDLGPLDEGDASLLASLAKDPSAGVAYTATVALARAGREPGRALAALLETSRRRDGELYFLSAERVAGDLRLVARVAAADETDLARLLGSVEPHTPVARGALEGLAETPVRAAAAAAWIGAMLTGAAAHVAPFHDGTLLKAAVGLGRPLGAPAPTVLPAVEARRLAARALAAAGSAALPHKALLEGLRKDPDVVLRWRVEQALRALPAR